MINKLLVYMVITRIKDISLQLTVQTCSNDTVRADLTRGIQDGSSIELMYFRYYLHASLTRRPQKLEPKNMGPLSASEYSFQDKKGSLIDILSAISN